MAHSFYGLGLCFALFLCHEYRVSYTDTVFCTDCTLNEELSEHFPVVGCGAMLYMPVDVVKKFPWKCVGVKQNGLLPCVDFFFLTLRLDI